MTGDRDLTRVHVERAMGTVVSFNVSAPSQVNVDDSLREAVGRMHALVADLTTFDPGSAMSAVRRGDLSLNEAPASIQAVLRECAVVRDLTDGWFDPWALPGGVDPTGLAKGWILEQVVGSLQQCGVTSAVVNGGGDVRVFGAPPVGAPWRIAIRHPWRADMFACVLAVKDAVATSGAYERGAHLFDPRRQCFVEAAASATVTGPDLTIADGLATALAVGGNGVLSLIEMLDSYDGYLIRSDGSESCTAGIRVVNFAMDHPTVTTGSTTG